MSTMGERILEAEAKGVTEKELSILCQAYLIELKYGLIPNRTKLKDLDTSKLHYVKIPENQFVIDFDIPGKDGEKSFELNLEKVVKDYRPYGIRLHDTAVFVTREEAETVYSQMVAIATRYGVLKVEDYYDLCGLIDVDGPKHIGFGWSKHTVLNMNIVKAPHGYVIDIPIADRLDAERRRRW